MNPRQPQPEPLLTHSQAGWLIAFLAALAVFLVAGSHVGFRVVTGGVVLILFLLMLVASALI